VWTAQPLFASCGSKRSRRSDRPRFPRRIIKNIRHAQLVNSEGFRREATYTPENVRKNLPVVYRALKR
jgi:hypothetical protein